MKLFKSEKSGFIIKEIEMKIRNIYRLKLTIFENIKKGKNKSSIKNRTITSFIFNSLISISFILL